MGFLDKLKEGAEQAKDLAAAAAERAKDEAKELSLKRQIANEQEALGEKAYALVEQGTISHPDLEPHVAKVRELTAELGSLRAEEPAKADEEAKPAPAADSSPAGGAGTAPESAAESTPESAGDGSSSAPPTAS
jgi:hypothetical protein